MDVVICEVHARLLSGVRGNTKRPGEFRTAPNAIGGGLESARFVPPPVLEMHDALASLEANIGNPRPYPPTLVQIALIHYQFETINPFMDGNGRMGRISIPLILAERQILPQPLLYLSSYFERHKDEYRDLLLLVNQQGEWITWINFFLRVVTGLRLTEDADRGGQLLGLQQNFRNRIQQQHIRSANIVPFADLYSNRLWSRRKVSRSASG